MASMTAPQIGSRSSGLCTETSVVVIQGGGERLLGPREGVPGVLLEHACLGRPWVLA